MCSCKFCTLLRTVTVLTLSVSADENGSNQALTNEESPECTFVCGGGSDSTNADTDFSGNSH